MITVSHQNQCQLLQGASIQIASHSNVW